MPYKLVFVAIVVVGPVLALDLVWTIADILNALMAIPNLIAVLLLSGVIARETRHYLRNLDEVDKTETAGGKKEGRGSPPGAPGAAGRPFFHAGGKIIPPARKISPA